MRAGEKGQERRWIWPGRGGYGRAMMSRSIAELPPLSAAAPVVAVPACRKVIEPHVSHAVGEKYLRALTDAARVVPVILPALGSGSLRALLPRLDGLFLTGSPSNVEPHHYGGSASLPGAAHDPDRDATTFGLIEAALAAGMPILAVCRGLQELNVVLGGTLHQRVQEVQGMMDHRAPEGAPLDEQYGPAHDLNLTPGGILARLAGSARVRVNTVHAQGIDTLASGAVVEATADDGLVEAFRLGRPGQFVLAVQWHPEWKVLDNPLSTALFREFGRACQAYADKSSDECHRAMV